MRTVGARSIEIGRDDEKMQVRSSSFFFVNRPKQIQCNNSIFDSKSNRIRSDFAGDQSAHTFIGAAGRTFSPFRLDFAVRPTVRVLRE